MAGTRLGKIALAVALVGAVLGWVGTTDGIPAPGQFSHPKDCPIVPKRKVAGEFPITGRVSTSRYRVPSDNALAIVCGFRLGGPFRGRPGVQVSAVCDSPSRTRDQWAANLTAMRKEYANYKAVKVGTAVGWAMWNQRGYIGAAKVMLRTANDAFVQVIQPTTFPPPRKMPIEPVLTLARLTGGFDC